MKQLSSIMAMPIAGGTRISYTYNTIDDESGEVVEANEVGTFFVTDSDLQANVDAIMAYVREHKLAE